MWFQETEGAKFWMQVLADLKQRGVRDILIACVDGLTGFPDAIEAIFPKTTVQTCIVHYADLPVMPTRVVESCGGGRIGPVGVGIIRALRGTRGACRVAGSAQVSRRAAWSGPALSL
jgi:hypothetical protein